MLYILRIPADSLISGYIVGSHGKLYSISPLPGHILSPFFGFHLNPFNFCPFAYPSGLAIEVQFRFHCGSENSPIDPSTL